MLNRQKALWAPLPAAVRERSPRFSNSRQEGGAETEPKSTTEVFLCFVAIVRVRVYYVDFFVVFVLRHWGVLQVLTRRVSQIFIILHRGVLIGKFLSIDLSIDQT